MEDDLEDDSREYHPCEHYGAAELVPPEGDEVYPVVIIAAMILVMSCPGRAMLRINKPRTWSTLFLSHLITLGPSSREIVGRPSPQ